MSNFSRETEVTVIYFYPRHDLKEAYEKAGIRLEYFGLKGKKDFRRGISKLTALIKRERPDVVVSSILRANIISRIACKRAGTPLIGTFVSDSYSEERRKSFSLKRKIGAQWYYWIDRVTSKIPALWIANSQSIKQSNSRFLKIDTEKVKVVYRGRDKNKFKPKENKRSGIFRFVFVGRLLETKGLAELVNAFSVLAEKHPDIHLDIYGDGPYRKSLASLIAASPAEQKIILHGAVSDGWKKMYDADAFVFPSWYEGFSGSLIEAMMVGIPIIASDIPMNLEAVENGKTALVFPVRNVSALTDSMREMMVNYESCVRMAESARRVAFEKFDISKIASEYENLLYSFVNSLPVKQHQAGD